jgi:hypothetical protein
MNPVVLRIIERWKPLQRDQAVRLHCLECAGENSTEVTLCPCTACPLWGFRMGNILNNKKARDRFEEYQEREPKEFEEAFGVADEPETLDS